MMVPILFGGAFVVLMVGSLYLTGRIAGNAKLRKQCIAFDSEAAFGDVREDFEREGVPYSVMAWSPSQSAYVAPGTLDRIPREIWVRKEDAELVKRIIGRTYQFEITEHAILVRGRRTLGQPAE